MAEDTNLRQTHFAQKNNGAFFYASNYSLGVNIFFKLNEYLAKMMKGLEEYEVSVDEIHHTEKKDAPSGTAITPGGRHSQTFRSQEEVGE